MCKPPHVNLRDTGAQGEEEKMLKCHCFVRGEAFPWTVKTKYFSQSSSVPRFEQVSQ